MVNSSKVNNSSVSIIVSFLAGRGKKNNNMGPLMAAAILKIGLIGGLAFKALALLVGKALLLSKIALLLAGIIGLKKLFSHGKHVTYEVVAHPHHEHGGHGDSYSSGWARNFYGQTPISGQADAHKLAYSAHVKWTLPVLSSKQDPRIVADDNRRSWIRAPRAYSWIIYLYSLFTFFRLFFIPLDRSSLLSFSLLSCSKNRLNDTRICHWRTTTLYV